MVASGFDSATEEDLSQTPPGLLDTSQNTLPEQPPTSQVPAVPSLELVPQIDNQEDAGDQKEPSIIETGSPLVADNSVGEARISVIDKSIASSSHTDEAEPLLDNIAVVSGAHISATPSQILHHPAPPAAVAQNLVAQKVVAPTVVAPNGVAPGRAPLGSPPSEPAYLKPLGIAVSALAGVVGFAGTVWLWNKVASWLKKKKEEGENKKNFRRHARDWESKFDAVASATW